MFAFTLNTRFAGGDSDIPSLAINRRLGIAIVANALMSWDQDPPERSAFT